MSADGERTTWVGVPATITADSERHLGYNAGTRYGFFTKKAYRVKLVRKGKTSPAPKASPA